MYVMTKEEKEYRIYNIMQEIEVCGYSISQEAVEAIIEILKAEL